MNTIHVSPKKGKPQLKRIAVLPPELWRRVKVQAVHEDCTASELVMRLAEIYLDSDEAKAARSRD